MNDDVQAPTVPATELGGASAERVSLPPVFVLGTSDGDRYMHEHVLGEGGMGIVALLRDQRIGRSVAMKLMRPGRADEDSLRRFVREAQLQGQLEHPAIVPVYDLGPRTDGSIFFTMKRIRGVTLHEVVQRVRRGDTAFAAKYSRRRLLGAFAQICLAVDFAHDRGVIHRDLKPANVMLGDFGEVYVLDWGISKVVDAPVGEPIAPAAHTPLPAPATQTGAMMGTVGYMSPEQLRGADVGPASDVYALGAILFELLALEPLHARDSLDVAVASTLNGVDSRPSARAPDRDVPPELDTACQTATALESDCRYKRARDLHDAVQSYLDGERDLDLRRAKASEHASAAFDALRGLDHASGHDEITARRHAMRELGKALTLDPGNAEATAAMVQLLTEPPKQAPPEVLAAIELGERTRLRKVARIGAAVYLGMWLLLPLWLWIGVTSAVPLVGMYSGFTIAGLCSLAIGRLRRPNPRLVLLPMLASNVGLAAAAGLLGPLVLVPTATIINTMAYAIHVSRAYRPLVFMAGLASFAVPLGLELAGALPASYGFTAAGMTILKRGLELEPVPTMIAMVGIQLFALVLAALVIGIIRDYVDDSERKTYTYAWHLRELVPESRRHDTDPVGGKKRTARGQSHRP